MQKMKQFLYLPFLLFSINLLADDNCLSIEHEYKKCNFTIEKSNSGKLSSSIFEDDNFKGTLVSKCVNGKNIIIKEKCEYEPVDLKPEDCSGLNSRSWLGENGEVCSHNNIYKILKDGSKSTIESNTDNKGSISYTCSNGVLTNSDRVCGEKKEKEVEIVDTLVGARAVSESCQVLSTNLNAVSLGDGDYALPSNESQSSLCQNYCVDQNFDFFDTGTNNAYALSGDSYTQSCGCCNYEDDVGTAICINNSNIIDVDTADITLCNVDGDPDPFTNQNTVNPENNHERLRTEICEANGYTNFDYTISSTINNPLVDEFHVEVRCSGNLNQPDADACRGDFLGDRDTAISYGVPYTCEAANCWENTCATYETPVSICLPCEAGNETWYDSGIGSNCQAFLPLVETGESKTTPFFNNNFNGNVEISCNNAGLTVVNSQCFNNCKGDVVTWGHNLFSNYYNIEKSGQCVADIADNNYRNDVLTPLLDTTTNTGDAVFRCNGISGKWNVETQECMLDCPSDVNWPNAETNNINDLIGREIGWTPLTSSNNYNKDMACTFNFSSNQKHNHTVTTNDTDPWNNGSATATCNDGFWEISGATCEVHCPEDTFYWGSGLSNLGTNKTNKCSTTFEKTADNSSRTRTTDDNSGSATMSCNNGEFSLGSNSCNLDCSSTIPAQSFTDSNGSYCNISSKTVSSFSHGAGHTFRNENGVTIGNIAMTCSDERWVINNSASNCAPKPCNATSKTWNGHGSCSQNIGSGVIGDTKTIKDTTFTTGSASYECRNTNSASNTGEWVLTSGTCLKGCSSDSSVSWSQSARSCNGSVSQGIAGSERSASDREYGGVRGGNTGDATFVCNGETGNWDFKSGTASCIYSRDDQGGSNWTTCIPTCSSDNSSVTASCPVSLVQYETSANHGIGQNNYINNRTIDTDLYKINNCPLNCKGSWSNWSSWSSCSNGEKTRNRTFNITTPSQFKGASCDNFDGEVETQKSTEGCIVNSCAAAKVTWCHEKYSFPSAPENSKEYVHSYRSISAEPCRGNMQLEGDAIFICKDSQWVIDKITHVCGCRG